MRVITSSLFFLVVLGVLAAGDMAGAAPARPRIVTLQQPDGLVFDAMRWGDEGVNGWETSSGYTIVRSESGHWFYAVKDSTGALIPTLAAAGVDAPPAEAFRARPLPEEKPDRLLKRQRTASLQRTLGLYAAEAEFPVTEGRIPVILANFRDREPRFSRDDFTVLLFGGAGTKSMAEYYREISYGIFTLSGEVHGWVNLPEDHNYYGRNDRSGYDDKPGRFVLDAVKQSDEAFDFSAYDLDGDCDVDVVAVIHQGSGEDGGGSETDIWSQRWTLRGSDVGSAFTTNDVCKADPDRMVTINDFIIMPETLDGGISTIGVFAHEYGHALGLPDLYDTDSSDSEGVGRWSLMASGSWNGVDSLGNPLPSRSGTGNTPAHMDPWCKYKLGWVTPTPIEGPSNECTVIAAAAAAPDPTKLVYQLGNGSAGTGEYFLVENRFRTGFDVGLPGQGLLIWHVDAAVRTNNRECWPGGSRPCTVDRHYKIALMQADNNWDLEKGVNRGDAGDPFPGLFGTRTYFGWASLPSSRLYNGKSSSVAVRNISSPALFMSATLDRGEECNYFITPNALSFGAGGGYGVLKVLTPAHCPAPEISGDVPGWISDSSVTATFVRMRIEPNLTGAEKSADVTIGNQKVNITVAGHTGPLNLQVNPVISRTVLKTQTLSGTVRRGSTVTVAMNGKTYAASVEGSDWWVPVDLQDGVNLFIVTASDGISLDETKEDSIEAGSPLQGHWGVVAERMPGGNISPAGMSDIPDKGSITYYIKPEPGYSLAGLSTAGTNGVYAPVSKKSRYAFRNITGNRGIMAKFKRRTYRISPKAGKGGFVSAAQTSVRYQDEGKVTFTPLQGYQLSRLVVDGAPVCGAAITRGCKPEDLSYTFDSVDRHHSIKAYFE